MALVESACKRAIGKELDLSEAYGIYRAIRRNMDVFGGVPYYQLRYEHETFAPHEWSHPHEILSEILGGSVCLEEELNLEEVFIPFVLKLKGELKEKHVEVETFPDGKGGLINEEADLAQRKVIGEQVCEAVDGKIRCLLPSARKAAQGWEVATRHADLQACFKQLTEPVRVKNLKPAQAVGLLSKNLPFLCIGRNWIGFQHAWIIQGHRYVEKTEKNPSGVEWLARDSSEGASTWRRPFFPEQTCAEAIVLGTKEEAEALAAFAPPAPQKAPPLQSPFEPKSP